jgi:hypothetical protein
MPRESAEMLRKQDMFLSKSRARSAQFDCDAAWVYSLCCSKSPAGPPSPATKVSSTLAPCEA